MTVIDIDTLISSILWKACYDIMSLENGALGMLVHPEGLSEEEIEAINTERDEQTKLLHEHMLKAYTHYEQENLEDVFCDYKILMEDYVERLSSEVEKIDNFPF